MDSSKIKVWIWLQDPSSPSSLSPSFTSLVDMVHAMKSLMTLLDQYRTSFSFLSLSTPLESS